MEIETHSPAVEETRRTLLRLLAADYPASCRRQRPTSHSTTGCATTASRRKEMEPVSHFTDTTHPYLRVDMERVHHLLPVC